MRRLLIIFVLGGWLMAQDIPLSQTDYTAYGQMIYWKSLTTPEKKVFLHAFLYRSYELYNQLQANPKLKNVAALYNEELLQPVLAIFSDLTADQKDDLIFWIDKFYRNDFNKTKSFYEALQYAHHKVQGGNKSLYETVKEQLE
jgi:hypothetical protein